MPPFIIQWIEQFKQPDVLFRLLVMPALGLIISLLYKKGWIKFQSFRKKSAERYKKRVAASARNDLLIIQAVVARSHWLVVFMVGGFAWFFFCTITPFSYFLDKGALAFGLTMSPVFLLEILYLRADSYLKDLLKEKGIK